MAADDLDTPLGLGRSDRRTARRGLPLWPIIVALALAVAAPIFWVLLVDDPLGGEPVAIVSIEQPKMESASATPAQAPAAAAAADQSGAQTVTIIDGKSGARTQVAVAAGEAAEPTANAPALDTRLTETSPHGPIPRLAPDGMRPLDAYSRADTAARKGPQIAVVVGGLGIGASATNEALTKLPPSVTLAFAPYGAELGKWVSRARATGHEILLQVPMEPFDYPDNDPGPQTLLSNLPAAQNIDRLHWFLSRFQGYVGVTNFMGARFTSNDTALAPVLGELTSRGLLYFDDGGSPRSLAAKVAGVAKTPFLKADLVVDAKPNWSDIDAALEQLERLAADRGYAIGMATALPVSIERVARWAKAAEARGIRVVPLSGVALRSKAS